MVKPFVDSEYNTELVGEKLAKANKRSNCHYSLVNVRHCNNYYFRYITSDPETLEYLELLFMSEGKMEHEINKQVVAAYIGTVPDCCGEEGAEHEAPTFTWS